uniref:Acyl_transf_3 domain-containing protein n=2 Tax=Bursaphelenchus xylophilus TaxID=6326 RepID=A0A1I7S696_BURXY
MYGRPCTKAGPFLIGLVLGFATSNLELKIRARLASRIALLGMALAVIIIYAILPEYWYPDAGNTLYNTLYTALFRTTFALAVSSVIFALFYSETPTAVSGVWTVLAKLTFNVYLWHMPVVYLFNFVPFYQTATSAMVLLILLPFLAILSFFAAFLFYLFVEDPIARISGALLQKL